jgi:hypothetical protein
MRSYSIIKGILALGLCFGLLAATAKPAQAGWWHGGWYGPRFFFHFGPGYRYYGPHPYYYGAPGFYRPRYYVPPYYYGHPYYYGPRYVAPAIGFGLTIR